LHSRCDYGHIYLAGEYIIHRGDPGRTLNLITKGACEILDLADDESVLAILGKGHVFGKYPFYPVKITLEDAVLEPFAPVNSKFHIMTDIFRLLLTIQNYMKTLRALLPRDRKRIQMLCVQKRPALIGI